MSNKISIRFYKDHKVRAIWDEKQNQWWFSVVDIIAAINDEPDYQKSRNYWKYLKTKLAKSGDELVSGTHQLKLTAPDGKKRSTDVLDADGVQLLARNIPNIRAAKFLNWFTYSGNTSTTYFYSANGSYEGKAVSTISGNRITTRYYDATGSYQGSTTTSQ